MDFGHEGNDNDGDTYDAVNKMEEEEEDTLKMKTVDCECINYSPTVFDPLLEL